MAILISYIRNNDPKLFDNTYNEFATCGNIIFIIFPFFQRWTDIHIKKTPKHGTNTPCIPEG